jgi:hypothetical protein
MGSELACPGGGSVRDPKIVTAAIAETKAVIVEAMKQRLIGYRREIGRPQTGRTGSGNLISLVPEALPFVIQRPIGPLSSRPAKGARMPPITSCPIRNTEVFQPAQLVARRMDGAGRNPSPAGLLGQETAAPSACCRGREMSWRVCLPTSSRGDAMLATPRPWNTRSLFAPGLPPRVDLPRHSDPSLLRSRRTLDLWLAILPPILSSVNRDKVSIC